MSEFKDIIENFKEEYEHAKKIGLINNKMIVNYDTANEKCLHSIIQYLLIKSGEKAGFIPIPEMKIEQDPTNYGLKNRRRQSKYKTDVAFYEFQGKEKKLVGISEVLTLDMLAHLATIERIDIEIEKYEEGERENFPEKVRKNIDNWIKKWKDGDKYPTTATKILYLIESSKEPIKNVLFVVVLPERLEKGSGWPDWELLRKGNNNMFEAFSPYLEELRRQIEALNCKFYGVLITETI